MNISLFSTNVDRVKLPAHAKEAGFVHYLGPTARINLSSSDISFIYSLKRNSQWKRFARFKSKTIIISTPSKDVEFFRKYFLGSNFMVMSDEKLIHLLKDKDFLNIFLNSLKAYHLMRKRNSEQAREISKLKLKLQYDDLTGLYNMSSFYRMVEPELQRSIRKARAMSIVMIDVDNLKTINDENDHLFGSFVLKEVGETINRVKRGFDIAARFGGDEFVVMLPETDSVDSLQFAERLSLEINNKKFSFKNYSSNISLTIGIATLESHITDRDEDSLNAINLKDLMAAADRNLLIGKKQGKNKALHSKI